MKNQVSIVLLTFGALVCFCHGSGIHIALTSGEVEVNKDYFKVPVMRVEKDASGESSVTIEGTTLQEIDNPDVRVELKLETEEGFKDFLSTPPMNLCTFLKEPEKVPFLKMIMDDMLKYGNFSTTCPIPKGDFYLHGFKVDASQLPPITPVGKYRMDMELLKGKDILYKAMFHSTISKS